VVLARRDPPPLLLSHPRAGASWEGYAIEQAVRVAQPDECTFWATHQGAELDLLLMRGGRRYGVEVKRQDAPGTTPSMRIALADLGLDHLAVLYPGDRTYELDEKVTVAPLTELASGDPAVILRGTRRAGRRSR
jgi:hypothetical protein